MNILKSDHYIIIYALFYFIVKNKKFIFNYKELKK
jgi:hypothetical protein